MRKPSATNQVETMIAVPEGAPASVETAWLKLDPLTNQLEDTRQALKDAPRVKKEAQRADRERNAADLAAGRTPKDPTKLEREAEAAEQTLWATVDALLVAIDQAGDGVAVAVNTEHDEWEKATCEQDAADYADYQAGLKATRAAVQRMATNRGVRRWLKNWQLVRGGNGEILIADIDCIYRGPGRVVCDTTRIRHETETPVLDVLDLLAAVALEDTPPTSRRHKVVTR